MEPDLAVSLDECEHHILLILTGQLIGPVNEALYSSTRDAHGYCNQAHISVELQQKGDNIVR